MEHPKIFCIGLAKTGTSTMAGILRGAGYAHKKGPVHDLLVYRELGLLSEIWKLVDQHDSFDDFPYPFMYKEAFERYPDAKFILTKRASVEVWLDSLKKHSLRVGPTDGLLLSFDCYAPHGHEERLIRMYDDHIADVRRFFKGSDRFLEIDWDEVGLEDKLANFLCVPRARIDIVQKNKATRFEPGRIIDSFIADKHFARAILYAKSLDDSDTWLRYISERALTEETLSKPLHYVVDRTPPPPPKSIYRRALGRLKRQSQRLFG